MVESADDVLKTYRYLRLAMVALVGMLAAGVVIGASRAGQLLTSLSAYYYTPAQSVFVGALVAIGVCLIVIRGEDTEDVALNLAGMLAPVVAGLTVAALSIGRTPAGGRRLHHLVGLGLAVSVVGLSVVLFLVNREGFDRVMHYAAAIPMFAAIIFVVAWNALRFRASTAPGADAMRSKHLNPYGALAALMVGSAAVVLAAWWLLEWPPAVLVLEAIEIALFAVFWGVQTWDKWDERGILGVVEQ